MYRIRLLAGLAALAILALVTLGSILAILPPAPQGADAPADTFSAARAYDHVAAIGASVHVTGSAAAGEVRDHIVDTLTGLGYDPQIRSGIGETSALGDPAMAYVENVVAEIAGSDSTGRLILMAHYDSVQVSYGANDDGSGTATLLEVARALREGPQLKNDVILLFTDAEEACLCGAAAFVADDPLAADGGVVLNFEARGANGPPVMFETAAGNADLIAQYAAAAPYPVATSMAVEVYRILPNDTDFTPFRLSERFTGLNSAYIDGVPVYHSPQDRPENFDRGTLQAQGSNALALTRQLGGADLGPLARPASGDATYFPVLGTLVRYPGTLVWPIAILALAGAGLLAVVVRLREGIGWGRLVGGLGMMLVPLLGAAALAQGFWSLLVLLRPTYGVMLDPWQPTWFRLAVCALAAFAVIGWYALWRKRFGPWALAVGAIGLLAVLGAVLAAATPGGSYLAALPALVGSAAGIVAVLGRAWWFGLGVMTISGAVAVLVLAPTVVLFFPALGLATGAAAALFAAMLVFALLPVIEFVHPALPGRGSIAADGGPGAVVGGPDGPEQGGPRSGATGYRRLAAAGASLVTLVAAVAFTGVGLVADRFDAQHPQPTQLMYALDADTGTAYWVSGQSTAGQWLDGYVTGEQDISAQFPLLYGKLLTGPAQAADLPAPQLTVDSDTANGAIRTLTVTVHPRPDARLVQLSAPEITVLSATVTAGGQSHGMAVDEHGFFLLFHAPPADGVTVTLTIDGAGPATFRLSDGSDGLTDLPGFTPRPADVGVQGSHTSELVLVSRGLTI